MDKLTPYDRQLEKLWQIADASNPDDHMYIYLVIDGRTIKPAVWSNVTPCEEMFDDLRDTYGTAMYEFLVRHRRIAILKMRMGIEAPINLTPERDIYADIERLQREKAIKERNKKPPKK